MQVEIEVGVPPQREDRRRRRHGRVARVPVVGNSRVDADFEVGLPSCAAVGGDRDEAERMEPRRIGGVEARRDAEGERSGDLRIGGTDGHDPVARAQIGDADADRRGVAGHVSGERFAGHARQDLGAVESEAQDGQRTRSGARSRVRAGVAFHRRRARQLPRDELPALDLNRLADARQRALSGVAPCPEQEREAEREPGRARS